jgi:hypothetical protein
MDPSPFLVVFSNERSNATLEETGLVSQRDLNALPDHQEAGKKKMADSVTVNDSGDANPQTRRQRRSIDDNELPEADHYLNSNVIPQTSPGMLQPRSSSSSSSRQSAAAAAGSGSSRKISGEQPSSGSGGKSTLPYPKSHSSGVAGATLAWPEDKRKRTGSSGGSNSRKGKRRNRKLPETWHYNQQVCQE